MSSSLHPEAVDNLRVALCDSDHPAPADIVDSLERAGIGLADADHADVLIALTMELSADEGEALLRLRQRHPNVGLLVVSGRDDVRAVKRALQCGADGLVTQARAREALAPAVRAVAAGQLCLPATYRVHVARPTFTTREKQILGLVVMGLSNGEISRKLYLAESTIKSHLSSAFLKMGVRSRNEATAQILDPSSGFGPGILRITNDIRSPRV